jgi:glyoxylase-like metal-dependent hydrolase (beta-lactamase superfamily II)
MKKLPLAPAGIVLLTSGLLISLRSQTISAANLVDQAAEALGGKARILAIKRLTIKGYGQVGTQTGMRDIGPSPYAPIKISNLSNIVRNIDFEHDRWRLSQTEFRDFVFAYESNMRGTRQDQRLDGNVAFNVGPSGFSSDPTPSNRATRAPDAAIRARRLDMLNNPISIVRAALDPAAKLSNMRMDRATNSETIDLITSKGENLTVAFDAVTKLPSWISWVQPDPNLGEVTVRSHFSGYQKIDGIQVPFGYQSFIDWRNTMMLKMFVDAVEIDKAFDTDLAAPADVRTVPARPLAEPAVPAEKVANGVWYLRGLINGHSIAFEFRDHVAIYEAWGSAANFKYIVDNARKAIPGKPITELIVSHHHQDHTAGLRQAVAEGLTTIYTQRANIEILQEYVSRTAKNFPDALERGGPKQIKFVPIDDKLVLKDDTMEVDIYRVLNNSHMANAILAYVPSAKVVAEADLLDEIWELNYWANSYPETVKFWGLDVATDLPVHAGQGHINTWQDVLNHLHRQVNNVKQLCAKADAANFSLPGCPDSITDF